MGSLSQKQKNVLEIPYAPDQYIEIISAGTLWPLDSPSLPEMGFCALSILCAMVGQEQGKDCAARR